MEVERIQNVDIFYQALDKYLKQSMATLPSPIEIPMGATPEKGKGQGKMESQDTP